MPSPFVPRVPLPPGLFLPVAVDPAGVKGPTRGVARGPGWRRVSANRWVPQVADPPAEQRIFDAAAHLTRHGAVTGWAALRAHGAAYFDGLVGREPRSVPLALGPADGRRRRPGISWSYERLPLDDLTAVGGLPVTTPSRALFDELRALPDHRDRVVAVEMALAARVVRLPDALSYAAAGSSWRRAALAMRALGEARHGARSPGEVRLRLLYVHDAGQPEPGVNVMLFDRTGRFVLCADLFDEEAGLVVEYDGAEHRSARRHARDAARAECARALGLEYTTVVGSDLASPARVVRRLLAARSRALFLPPGERLWTTEWPPGWAPWWS